jgi:hypothetical protein
MARSLIPGIWRACFGGNAHVPGMFLAAKRFKWCFYAARPSLMNKRDPPDCHFVGLTLATEDDNEKSPFALVGIDKSHGALAAASRSRLPVLGCFIYKVLPVSRAAAFWQGNKVAVSYMPCTKSAENRGVFIHGKRHHQQSPDDVC